MSSSSVDLYNMTKKVNGGSNSTYIPRYGTPPSKFSNNSIIHNPYSSAANVKKQSSTSVYFDAAEEDITENANKGASNLRSTFPSGGSQISQNAQGSQEDQHIFFDIEGSNTSCRNILSETTKEQMCLSNITEESSSKRISSTPHLSLIESDTKQIQLSDTIYMNDNQRRIDFVLVNNFSDKKVSNFERRSKFERSLSIEGLEFETFVDVKNLIRYLKIHAPWEILTEYAEELKYDMPILRNDISESQPRRSYGKYTLPQIDNFFTAPFTRGTMGNFLIQDQDTFFTPAQRSAIVDYILKRVVFIEEFHIFKKVRISFETLLKERVYVAAYPLHDGVLRDTSTNEKQELNLRQLLYHTWGTFSNLFRIQPIDHIRLYFGESVGFFFAWLGVYTTMLIPLSIFGVYVFLYGIVYMIFTEESHEVCDESGTGNITMCPICEEVCNFWKLSEICMYSKAENLLDNELTIVFAILNVLWSYAFIEVWKHHEKKLIQAWSMQHFLKNELIRPEYIELATLREINPVTACEEPVIPKPIKYKRNAVSTVFNIFYLIVTVLGFYLVVLVRTSLKQAALSMNYSITIARVISSVGGTMSFILIFSILEVIYIPLAKLFTSYEAPRTESEWEERYIVKAFIFRFLGNIIYIVYVAFFRELINQEKGNSKASGLKLELFGSVTTIIVVQQMNLVVKRVAWAKFLGWINKSRLKGDTIFQRDYSLREVPEQYLADEYVGYVLQYGMLTCFAAIFPFSAFFALITNLVLIRLSAYSLIAHHRRPIAQRLHGIGIWISILTIISKIATIMNAFLIVFSSDFITRQVYLYTEKNETYGLTGYVEFSLHVDNASKFKPEETKYAEEKTCMTRGFKQPFNATNPYMLNAEYWKVRSAEFLFVICFTIGIDVFHTILFFLLPNLGKKIQVEQMREAYVIQKLFRAVHSGRSDNHRD